MLDIQNQIDAGLSAANPLKKGLDLMSVWGHLKYAELVIISVKKEWFF